MADSARPLLVLTMGDPVGVGPDLVATVLNDPAVYQRCRPLVAGDLPALERACRRFAPGLTLRVVSEAGEGRYQAGAVDLLALSRLDASDLHYGKPTAAGGAAMVSYILTAVDLAMRGEAAGVVTGPISKLAMHLAGYPHPGHTELLAERTGAPEVAMMLAGGEFRVVLATIHCALAEAPGRLSRAGLLSLMRLTCRSLSTQFGLAHPRLGVAALNPHAGEGGLFGREEEEIIAPAVRQAQAEGLPVEGPFPADTLFWRHRRGEFAAILCMYHDQGLIPLKLLHFMDGVNVTLGLPIIRTSVDHGTAYDLAGTGRAHPGSLAAAIFLAAEMAGRKENLKRNLRGGESQT
ncbi:MAG: 4-hydroxythreonine-4-phosphate dehydrogenase PdxA [Deltaproteobacteria bacterium]|nr:4-hydroxythreonine-4-phosphate dehydrogenase PdxA [Deltaproteobacteria bacterium]